MIDIVLSHIAAQLELALRPSFDVASERVVEVSNLVNLDGSVATNVANRMVVFLAGIEREALAYREAPASTNMGRIVNSGGPAHLNLLVMCAANYGSSNYAEALKLISATVAFFQARPVLDAANTPDLHPQIQKLALAIENLDVAALSNLWGVLGGKYLPSVLYRVRMVTVDAGMVTGQSARVRAPATGVRS